MQAILRIGGTDTVECDALTAGACSKDADSFGPPLTLLYRRKTDVAMQVRCNGQSNAFCIFANGVIDDLRLEACGVIIIGSGKKGLCAGGTAEETRNHDRHQQCSGVLWITADAIDRTIRLFHSALLTQELIQKSIAKLLSLALWSGL